MAVVLKVFDLVPGWLYALIVGALLAFAWITHAELAATRTSLSMLQAAVKVQQDAAAQALRAEQASVLALQRTLDATHIAQEKTDAANVKAVAAAAPGLAGALAARSFRLCQPAPGRAGGAGAAGQAAAGAHAGR